MRKRHKLLTISISNMTMGRILWKTGNHHHHHQTIMIHRRHHHQIIIIHHHRHHLRITVIIHPLLMVIPLPHITTIIHHHPLTITEQITMTNTIPIMTIIIIDLLLRTTVEEFMMTDRQGNRQMTDHIIVGHHHIAVDLLTDFMVDHPRIIVDHQIVSMADHPTMAGRLIGLIAGLHTTVGLQIDLIGDHLHTMADRHTMIPGRTVHGLRILTMVNNPMTKKMKTTRMILLLPLPQLQLSLQMTMISTNSM